MLKYAQTSNYVLQMYLLRHPSSAASHSMALTCASSRNSFQSCLIPLLTHSSSGTRALRPLKHPSRWHGRSPVGRTLSPCKVSRHEESCNKDLISVIFVIAGGYHGRTFGAAAVTKSKTVYSEGTYPLMVMWSFRILSTRLTSLQPGAFATPFPFWHQLGLPPNTGEEELVRLSLYQLDLVLKQQTAPRDTAAIIVEPVLGEGGYVPAPASFLKGLRDVCDKYGILLIVDEVQSGFGRTGKYFNIEYSGVRPDIMTIAKVQWTFGIIRSCHNQLTGCRVLQMGSH